MTGTINVKGEMKVDLSKINVDFSSGLNELGEQIDSQVDALAESQINMLDAVIAVLEVIVAMEDLKNLDIDGGLTLDFKELGIKVEDGEITERTAFPERGTCPSPPGRRPACRFPVPARRRHAVPVYAHSPAPADFPTY